MTSHIHINSPTDGITCYELDNEDHENQCHGTDSHGAHGGLATKTDSECKATFDTALAAAAANDPASAACPSGCTFVAKPVMTRNIVPHPADQFSGHPSRRGWKEGVAGACRQKQGRGSNAMRAAAGKYCNKACFDPADADPVYGGPTQAACWQACQDEGLGCIAYHHGEPPCWAHVGPRLPRACPPRRHARALLTLLPLTVQARTARSVGPSTRQ